MCVTVLGSKGLTAGVAVLRGQLSAMLPGATSRCSSGLGSARLLCHNLPGAESRGELPACILLGLLLLRRRQRAVSEGAVACRGPGQTRASNPAAGREPRAGPLRALFAQGKASRARREEIRCLFFVGSPRVGADGTALPCGAGGSRSLVRVEGARCPTLSPVKAPTLLIICPSRSAECHVSCYLLGA